VCLVYQVNKFILKFLLVHVSHRWWIAYRDALSFRSSHYFVSFLSEASALMSGFGHHEDEPWSLSVARPQFIEIPRSLVQVVVYWNVPMHNWLKNCEYVDSFSHPTIMHKYYSCSSSWGFTVSIGSPFSYSVAQSFSSASNSYLELLFQCLLTTRFFGPLLCVFQFLTSE
jgi:hypothetical protein